MVTSTQPAVLTETLAGPLVRTVTYTVTPQDSVRNIPLSSEFALKPPVMASARLLAVCEWPCMDLLRERIAAHECSLGASQCLEHLAPARIGTQLVITARAVTVDGHHSSWYVEVHDQLRVGVLVARATLSFAVVDQGAFEHRLHTMPMPARTCRRRQ
ncbi:thioesterase family protein [Actinophytocola oryzae]|uniref:Thioesterase superfamily protein n=1 Tax=Actinophytocola oryzae TaxID=502181 RepID=A0A4R7V5G5_9PSEU|nr:hypothetical protein [Actinophytocola oryzae]TDV44180.1 thioesterase superfamily protein [Actinophytocola oryzae]